MKKHAIPLAILTFFPAAAMAQSSVTLYGLIDAGITYLNSTTAGGAVVQGQDGAISPSRWGLKGSEDLGGGTSAIFTLENGFSIFRGTLGQGGLEFGRQAFVGLANERYGSMTLGRQYDAMVDMIAPFTANGMWSTSFMHPGDNDNTNRGFRLNNAVKYTSPSVAGVRAEAAYAFGGQPGSVTANSAWTAGLSYANGPLSAALGYTDMKNPAANDAGTFWSTSNVISGAYALASSSYHTYGGAAAYTIGPTKTSLSFTDSVFRHGYLGGNVEFRNYEINSAWYVRPQWLLAAAYAYTTTQRDVGGNAPDYHQVSLMCDYFLSKRTDLYLDASWQLALGPGARAQVNQFLSASGTNRQLAVSAGIRTRF
ncbi:porin [Burkholderia multivorans]|uniref:porin n=1 Tax=Burkholderia multivorans TaxID=87883 RepID=UPI000D00E1B2|nr:porin [Burkholderia multivorans]PRG69719.1 porin [Burkholderia multivorans]